MREVFEDLQSEVRGAWRFRWPAMVVAWVICLVGWSTVFLMPDQYAAEAQFFVDPTSRTEDLLKGLTVEADEGAKLAMVREEMLSRPMLESVARATDLDLRASTPQEQEDLIDSLGRMVKIQGDSLGRRRDRGAASLYRITFRDENRIKGVAVVDALLENFKKKFVMSQATGTDEAIEFIEAKVEEYKLELQQRERALADFQRRYRGLLPNDRGNYATRMEEAINVLESLETQLRIAMNRRDALRGQLPSQRPATDSLPAEGSISTPRTELEERIVELEDQHQTLLLSFTPRHPDVVATRARLDQLYERRRAEMEELAEASGMEGPVSNNPVVQEVQIALNEANVEVASLESQVGAQRVRVADFQAKVDLIPTIEAELAELTRDYAQVTESYKQMRSRLEKELLFRQNREFEGSNFRIVQPPVASLEPVAPDRPRLLVAILFGGLLIGAGLSYLLHMLRPVFVDPRSLTKVTGLPVLGSVSMTWLSLHRTRRWLEAGSIAVVIVSLVLALVLVLVFQDAGVEAAAKFKRMALL